MIIPLFQNSVEMCSQISVYCKLNFVIFPDPGPRLQVLKALTILDSGRRIRREEKRLAELRQRAKTAGAKGKSRIGRKSVEIKKNILNLNAMKPGKGSVSGSLARKVRLWTRTLVKEKLEFYALHLPTETWTQLADMCHLHPENVRSPFHSS